MNTYGLLGTSSYFTEVVVGAMPTLTMPKKALLTIGIFFDRNSNSFLLATLPFYLTLANGYKSQEQYHQQKRNQHAVKDHLLQP